MHCFASKASSSSACSRTAWGVLTVCEYTRANIEKTALTEDVVPRGVYTALTEDVVPRGVVYTALTEGVVLHDMDINLGLCGHT